MLLLEPFFSPQSFNDEQVCVIQKTRSFFTVIKCSKKKLLYTQGNGFLRFSHIISYQAINHDMHHNVCETHSSSHWTFHLQNMTKHQLFLLTILNEITLCPTHRGVECLHTAQIIRFPMHQKARVKRNH